MARVAGQQGLEREIDMAASPGETALLLELLRRLRHRRIGGHHHDGGDAAERCRPAAAFEIFLVREAGLAKMDVRVHEARENDASARVESFPRRRRLAGIEQGGHFAILYRDGAQCERVVRHPAAAHYEIEHQSWSPPRSS